MAKSDKPYYCRLSYSEGKLIFSHNQRGTPISLVKFGSNGLNIKSEWLDAPHFYNALVKPVETRSITKKKTDKNRKTLILLKLDNYRVVSGEVDEAYIARLPEPKDEGSQVKVLDFGSSAMMTNNETAKRVVGEIFGGLFYNADSDLYKLGFYKVAQDTVILKCPIKGSYQGHQTNSN